MEEKLEKYRQLLSEHPELFNSDSPFEIIKQMDELEKFDEEIGVYFQDRFITLVRDLVRFPGGRLGTYNRIINTAVLQKGGAGAVVLPVKDGKVLLLQIFRHPTQQWSIEIPRGFGEPGMTPEEVAEKEIGEEIEGKIKEVIELGLFHSNTGLEGNDVYLYLAVMEEVGDPSREEGIENLFWVTVPELETMIASGEITDGFTIGAYARAKLKGYL